MSTPNFVIVRQADHPNPNFYNVHLGHKLIGYLYLDKVSGEFIGQLRFIAHMDDVSRIEQLILDDIAERALLQLDK